MVDASHWIALCLDGLRCLPIALVLQVRAETSRLSRQSPNDRMQFVERADVYVVLKEPDKDA